MIKVALEQRIKEAIKKAGESNEFELLGEGCAQLATASQISRLIAFFKANSDTLTTFTISIPMGIRSLGFVTELFNCFSGKALENLKFGHPDYCAAINHFKTLHFNLPALRKIVMVGEVANRELLTSLVRSSQLQVISLTLKASLLEDFCRAFASSTTLKRFELHCDATIEALKIMSPFIFPQHKNPNLYSVKVFKDEELNKKAGQASVSVSINFREYPPICLDDIIKRNQSFFRAQNSMSADSLNEEEVVALISDFLGAAYHPTFLHPEVVDLISELFDQSKSANKSLRALAQTQFEMVYNFLTTVMIRSPNNAPAAALLIGELISTRTIISESAEQQEDRVIKALTFFLFAKNSNDKTIVETAMRLFGRYMMFVMKKFQQLSLQALFDENKNNFLRIIFKIIPNLLQFLPLLQSGATQNKFYIKEVNITNLDSVMESLSEKKGCNVLFNHLLVYFTGNPAISDNPNSLVNKRKEPVEELTQTPLKVAYVVSSDGK